MEEHMAVMDCDRVYINKIYYVHAYMYTLEKSPILLKSSPPEVVDVGERRVSLEATQQDWERSRGVP